MARDAAPKFRLYCICGQKMRIAESMLGRPGKCIACRQKIWIPKASDFPSDTRTIYLKDRPEFVRRPQERPVTPEGPSSGREEAGPVEADKGGPAEELHRELQEEVGAVSPTRTEEEESQAVPLEVLEPLRTLCNLEHTLKAELRREEAGSGKARSIETTLARVREARSNYDEQLTQRLTEAAIDLASTREKLRRAHRGIRTGDMAFPEYCEQVERLREHRDRLERRQANLRGWLATHDPFRAGGLKTASLDVVPSGGFHFTFPPEPEQAKSLVDLHIADLNRAFELREQAESRRRDAERLRVGGQTSTEALEDLDAECAADQARADAALELAREQLNRLRNGYADDSKTADIVLEQARGLLQNREMTQTAFDALERQAFRAKDDMRRARDLIKRALSASGAEDLPYEGGSFLMRLAKPAKQGAVIGTDSWLAWAAAGGLFLYLVLPGVGDQSAIMAAVRFRADMSAVFWAVCAPLAACVAAAALPTMRRPGLRSILLGALWLLSTWVAVSVIHEAHYSPSRMAALFREGGPLLARPGILMLILSNLMLLAAGWVAMARVKDLRYVPPGLLALGVAGALLVGTDFGGLARPAPYITLPALSEMEGRLTAEGRPSYAVTIRVGNRGARKLYLASGRTSMRNGAFYGLEQKRGTLDSWQAITLPVLPRVRELESPLIEAVSPGAQAKFAYHLWPGEYRVFLASDAWQGDIVEQFTLPDASASAEETSSGGEVPSTASQEPTEPASEETSTTPRRNMSTPAASVALVGIVSASAERPAEFSIAIRPDNAPERRGRFALGDVVHGDWRVREYNPSRGTVTLATDAAILILRKGEWLPLSSVSGAL